MKTLFYRPNQIEMSRLRVARGLLNFEKDFPQRLRYLRRERGLRPESVAAALKVESDIYSHWEDGEHLENVPFLLLAEIFGVGVQELVTGEKSLEEEISAQLRTISRELEQIREKLTTIAVRS